jgi:hypothetical protein
VPTNAIFSEKSSNVSEFKTETQNAGIMVISQAFTSILGIWLKIEGIHMIWSSVIYTGYVT